MCDLPACSNVPQPRPLAKNKYLKLNKQNKTSMWNRRTQHNTVCCKPALLVPYLYFKLTATGTHSRGTALRGI
jgi:hypothetical protein